MHRTALGDIGQRLGHVQESGDPAGGRRVDHDGVIQRSLVGVESDGGFLDFAGQQDVAQPRSDRGGELDRPDPAHRPPGQSKVVEHVEVFQERGLEVDGQRIDVSAAVGGCDLDFLVGQRWNIEELGNALAPFNFHQQHLPATGCQCQRQRSRDRGLAGSPLASDEMESGLGQAVWPADCAVLARIGRHHCMLAKAGIGEVLLAESAAVRQPRGG